MSMHARTKKAGFKSGKVGRLMIAGPLVGLASLPALAGPQGEQVVHGSAQFIRNGDQTLIRTSDVAIINYSSFDLASWESVQFLQPGASSRVLNRIQSGMPTYIDGSVSANGSVYFVNNAGIIFGANSVINVGSLYAAAGNISNRDFIGGADQFTDLSGEVVNHGRIEAGKVSLLGQRVANFGQIVAPRGVVTFASADEVFIGQRGSHVFARITAPGDTETGGIEQAGTIEARDVSMTVGDHFALAVTDSSRIQAQRVAIQGGKDSTVTVSGEIDATRAGDRGGQVDVFGGHIVLDGAQIDASGDLGGGQIRIGGDYQGRGPAPRATHTLVTPETLLRADALLAGSGGRVIVWSDTSTAFGGFISARGGELGGDGGFVEVSGRRALHYSGLADVRSNGLGKSGELLLDPQFITIVDGPGSGWPPFGADGIIDFSEGVEETVIDDVDLTAQLDLLGAGGVLTLQAATDIRFRDNVSVVSIGQGELRLEAGRTILFQNNVMLDLGTGSLTAIANSDGYVPVEFSRLSGNAAVNMFATSQIVTNGGTVDLRLQNFGDSTDIIISTINAGATGTVLVTHTGNKGAGNPHDIRQRTGTAGITAGTVELSAQTAGSAVGTQLDRRIVVTADNLQVETGGGVSFLELTQATDVSGTGIATNGGTLNLTSASLLTVSGGIDTGAGDVNITTVGMSVGSTVSGENVTIGSTGAFDLTAGGRVEATTNADLTATAYNLDAGAGLSGGSQLLLVSTGAMNLSQAAVDQLEIGSGGTLTLQTTGGDLTLGGNTAAFADAGMTTLDSSGELIFNGAAGTIYSFGSIDALAANGMTFSSDVVELDSSGALRLNAGAGAVNVNNANAFVFSATNGTTLQSELITAANLTVLRQLDFDGGFITGGSRAISLEGSYFNFAAGGDLVTTTGRLALIGIGGAHTFWIGDDTQIISASGLGADDVLVGNSFLDRLQVGTLTTGRSFDVSLTATVDQHFHSAIADALGGGGIARVGIMRAYSSDHITFNEQTSSFRGLEVFTGNTAGADNGVVFRLADAGQQLQAVDGGLLLDAGAGTIYADDAFSGHITLNSTTGSEIRNDVTAANGLTVNGASTFSGTAINTSGGAVAFNGDATFDGGDVTVDATNNAAAGANIDFAALNLTGGNLELISGNGNINMTGTATAIGRNVTLTTTSGVVTVSDVINTAGGDISVNLGAGSLSLTPGATRLDAGIGSILLNADDWTGGAAFDTTTVAWMNAGRLAVTAVGAGGGVDVSGPDVSLANIPLIQFVSSPTGMVQLLGAGDYQFDAVELLGGAGVELPAGLTSLAANNTILLDAGTGVVNVANPGAFTISSANGTTLRSELTTSADLTVLGQLIFDGGFISAGNKNVLLQGSYYNLAAGGDLVTTTGTLSLIGVNGDHTFWIGDDAQIVTASGADPDDVLIGNTFLHRLNVAQLDIGQSTDLVLTQTLAANFHSAEANELVGGVTPRIDLLRVFARNEVSFNEQVSSFDDLEARSGNAIRFDGDATATNDMLFVGNTLIDGTAARTITAGNGVMFWGQVDLGTVSQLTIDARDIDFRDATGTLAGSVFGGDPLQSGLALLPGNRPNIEIGDVAAPSGDALVIDQLDLASLGTTLARVQFGGGNADIVVGDNAGASLTLPWSVLFDVSSTGRQLRFENGLTLVDAGEGIEVLGSGDTTHLAGNFVTNGGDVLIADSVVVEGPVSIATSGGSAIFNGTIRGLVAGADSLTLDTGAGAVEFRNSVGTAGAGEYLALLEVLNAGQISFMGTTYRAFDQRYNSAGHSIAMAGGGTVEFLSEGGEITFMGGAIALDPSNDLRLTAATGGVVTLTDLTRDASDSDARVVASVLDAINFANIGGANANEGFAAVDLTAGHAIFNGASYVQNYTITADEADFLGGPGSVHRDQDVAGGSLTIVESSAGRAIHLGGDESDATVLSLSDTDVAAFASDLAFVRIGDSGTFQIVTPSFGGALSIGNQYFLTVDGTNINSNISIFRDITSAGGGALDLTTNLLLLSNAAIDLNNGSILLHRAGAGPAEVRIRQASQMMTHGGAVNLDGNLVGTTGFVNTFAIDTTNGGNPAGAITLGSVGSDSGKEILNGLTILGGDVSLGDIGLAGTIGVDGVTVIDAMGTLNFLGSIYNTNQSSYASGSPMTSVGDLTFLSNGNELRFGEAGNAGRGSLTLATNADLTIDSGAGDTILDGNYVGTGSTMSLTGGRIVLAGDTTFQGASQLTFAGPIVGRHNLTVNMPGGTVDVLQNVGGASDANRLMALTMNAGQINFRMLSLRVDSASFAASTGFLLRPDVNDILGQRFATQNGDLTFNGGEMRFESALVGGVPAPQAVLTLVAENGNLALTDLVGGAQSTTLHTAASGLLTLGRVGTNVSTGVGELRIIGRDLVLNGDLHFRLGALVRPFNPVDGTPSADILVGANFNAGTAAMEISQAMLDRFIPSAGAALNIGGSAAVHDPNAAGFGIISLPSLSRVTLSNFTFAHDLAIFGTDITLVSGQQVTMNGGGLLRLTGNNQVRLDGDLVSQAGRIVLDSAQAILNSTIDSNGGDVFVTTAALVDSSATIRTRGGNLSVGGTGVNGLNNGLGDFVLDLGNGLITFGANAGFGVTTRLGSVDLTANQLVLTTVRTSGDQNFHGATNLVLNGGTIDSLTGNIFFHNRVDLVDAHTVRSGGSGVISFADAIVGTGQQGKTESLTLETASGATEFRGSVNVAQTLNVIGAAHVMNGGGSFQGRTVSFAGPVLSSGVKKDLVITATDVAELLSDVGGGNPNDSTGWFNRVLATAPQIHMGMSGQPMRIDTCSLQQFDGASRIAGDVIAQAHGTPGGVLGADSIAFLGAVDGATAGADSLTLLVDRTAGRGTVGASTPPANVPVLRFMGGVGENIGLGRLSLNESGRSDAGGRFSSVLATIVFGDANTLSSRMFTIRANDFNMGFGEALTSMGGLDISGQTGKISDLAARGNLFVNFSNSLTVQSRGAGLIFDPLSNIMVADSGTDLVAAGSMQVSTPNFIIAAHPTTGVVDVIQFASTGANFQNTPNFNGVLFRALPAGSVDLFYFAPQDLVLNPQAAGATNVNVAEALAGVARVDDTGKVEQGSTVGSTIRKILDKLGLQYRASPEVYYGQFVTTGDLTKLQASRGAAESLVDALTGAALYVDTADLDGDKRNETSLGRLEKAVTTDVIMRSFLNMWAGQHDQAGNLMRDENGQVLYHTAGVDAEGETIYVGLDDPNRAGEDPFPAAIDACLAELIAGDPDYTSTHDVIPADTFLAFLMGHASEHAQALSRLEEMRQFFEGLELMGLSVEERNRVWKALFETTSILPPGFDIEGFRSIFVNLRPLQIAANTDADNGKEPVVDVDQ